MQIKPCRPSGPTPRTRIAEGQINQALLSVKRHQLVPTGVKLDLIDAAAARVEGLELGRVAVGLVAPGIGLGLPQDGTVLIELRHEGLGARAHQSLLQGGVGGQQVVVFQFVKLVADLVCLPSHARSPVGVAKHLVVNMCLVFFVCHTV